MATVLMDSTRSSPIVYENIFAGDTKTLFIDEKPGDEVLSAKFIKELESAYNKADMHDKTKCLELITSATFGEDLKRHVKIIQRPKTAMPTLGHSSMSDPYQTSYERDYPLKTGKQLWAFRPMTSLGHVTSVSESKQPGPTVYDIEYCRKFQRPASPERSGTSSGQRNNKPHPPQSFLVWKFPSKNRYSLNQDGGCEDLTNEKLRQITKRLCHSVYQNDYLGIPQGFQVSSAFSQSSHWKDNIPYGMNSSQREAYQKPRQQQELTVPTTRYGSNTQKHTAAIAAIPGANKWPIYVHQRTTYDRHYNKAEPGNEQIINAGKHGAETLPKNCMRNSRDGREQTDHSLHKLEGPHHLRSQSHERAICSAPPSSVGSMLGSEDISPATQRHQLTSPLEKKYACSSKIQQCPSASHMANTVNSATKPRPLVPPATAIMIPPKFVCEVEMPTTPSVVYTPPLFLS